MKIIIIGTAHPYRGGLATFNERMANQFHNEGHDVEMITFTLQYPSFLFPGKTQFTDDPKPINLSILRQINSINPINWIQTGKEIRNKNADIVIFCYWMSFMAPCFGTIARQIRKNKKSKLIALVHNMIPHESTILDKILPFYFVSKMHAFVSLSKSVIHDINTFDKKNKLKIYTPHPIYDHYGEKLPREVALERIGLDKNYRYLLFFGFIRRYKGLDLLLDAFADNRLRKYHTKLIVAGEFYENEEGYREKIKDLQLEPWVELHTEFIPNDLVNAYFSACDIVTQPYKTATQSGVTQIAFHFEKAMLVTKVGGLAEIVPHGLIGYTLAPDAKTIAEALVDFFENNRQAEFESNVIKEKNKYAWSKLTEKIIALSQK
ncbi:MAG: glycosyltransferase [Bacteroidales bacterium]|jgi:D-inositol-3-phosphate glycosyltransferase|nr:glycosyltransferase [Bacteroidales bacterium]MDD2688054.1 glycosyltransferase [Bacteroidales bacterium]MDD3329743.1 glycosyltransferase [Bacteroidales bacterium]MDD3690467.1 glycosyltransferase [Bacteroidales bacterium]MDD4044342.1 glycosyltransferase [Bacteroidales bacterium]